MSEPLPVLVMEIRWVQDGTECSRVFGPWMAVPGESHLAEIKGFVTGWRAGSGIDPLSVTLAGGETEEAARAELEPPAGLAAGEPPDLAPAEPLLPSFTITREDE